MYHKSKILFMAACIATAAQAKEQYFSSGVGFTAGIGLGGASTNAKEGTSNGSLDVGGHFNNVVPDIFVPAQHGFGPVLPGGRRPVVPAHLIPGGFGNAMNPEGKPESFVNFLSPGKVKNNSGFAATVGVLAQHVSQSGFTAGVRWLWGRTGASSTIKYQTGYMQLRGNNNKPAFTLDLSDEDTQSFKLKDKWFTAFIAELGYTAGRFQFYMGPGVAFHRQKLSCINSSGKASGGLTKTVTSPMFALGTRYALTKRMSLGLEWQRHVGSKKSWTQVSKIIPEGAKAYGSPVLKMNNNVFLFSMNYVFGGK